MANQNGIEMSNISSVQQEGRRLSFDDLHNPNEESHLPPTDGGRQAIMVMLACCLMQIPAWGFIMSYGVINEFYTNPNSSLHLKGNISSTGTIGLTLNGLVYISSPFLFGLLARRLSHFRIHALILGAILSVTSTVASAFVDTVSGLIATQGVLQAFGAALLYSSSTIFLDEWWIQRKGFGYGMTLSTKSAVGVVFPLVFSALLSHVGYRTTLLIWSGIVLTTFLPIPFLLKPRIEQSSLRSGADRHYRRTSWAFLKHRTFPVFAITNLVFATSYGIPQTYLSTFAASALRFNSTKSTLMLVALNVPSIAAPYWFGTMGDGEISKIFRRQMSIATVTGISALGSAISILFFWGMTPSMPYAAGVVLLALFSVTYGFFAGGYSATWDGVLKELRREADMHGEIADTALLVGLMNGTRGIGFIISGLASVELLKVGSIGGSMLAYGGRFGSLITFAGCGAAVCGLGVLIRAKHAA